MRAASLLGEGPFFDPNVLPLTHELRNNFPRVQAEILQVLKRQSELPSFQDISPEQTHLTTDDKWKVFFFKGLWHVFRRNALEAPVTASILNNRRMVVSAFVSVLGPHKMLNPHCGPSATVLRLHLGIDVPEGDLCTLVVDGAEYHWKNGEFVFFDDTYEHMAINESDKSRAVLFMDIVRPMPFFWSLVAQAMIYATRLTAFFKEPLRRHEDWERRFYAD